MAIISLRRSHASATTPLTTEKKTIGTTLTRPTSPSASPFFSDDTSRDTCHKSAAFCIIEPLIDTSSPIQISRKLRCWSAGTDWREITACMRAAVLYAVLKRSA